MKKLHFLLLSLLLTLFSSCVFQQDGTICVSNYSSSLNITNIALKEKEENGYITYFNGNLTPGNSYYITVKPGSYSIQIQVSKDLNEFFEISGYTETGYNIYKSVSSNETIKAIFDGEGIFFE